MKVELLAVTPDAETLIEKAGRTCYQSGEKIAEDTAEKFIKGIIKRGHLSVLEHAYATFKISGCSRVMTHQLVRHRLMAISQQSQRYVNEANFSYVTPDSIRDTHQGGKLLFREAMEYCKRVYRDLQHMGIPNQDARFVLPNAVCSEIIISADFREFRHIFDVRCTEHAQWEIRAIAIEMLRQLQQVAPSVFGDYVIAGNDPSAYSSLSEK